MRNPIGLVFATTFISVALGCGGNNGSNSSTNNTNSNPPTVQPSAQNGCSSSTSLTSGDNTASCGITASGGQGPYTWTVNNTTCQTSLTVFESGTGLGCLVSGAGNSNLTIQPLSSTASAHSAEARFPQRRASQMASSPTVNVPVNVSVAGASGKASTLPSFTITVTIKALGISSTQLPNGTVGVAYSASVSASGGVPPYSWQISGLPQGLTSTGASISGTPIQSGTFTLTITLNDSEATHVQVQVTLSLTISAAALSITPPSPLPGATLNSAYTSSIAAAGGTPPYTFSVDSSSSLPSGLMLASSSPSATLSGTPTETGTFQFTIDVHDAASNPLMASAKFLITVTGSSTNLNCPAIVNLALCGIYGYGLAGANSAQGFAALGAFMVNNSGNVISGNQQSNDSVAGHQQIVITGGSAVIDPSADGRGVLTLIDSSSGQRTYRFVVPNAANGPTIHIQEFDSTGIIAEGNMFGPESSSLPGNNKVIPFNFTVEGATSSGQRSAMLAPFQVGSNGCDGTSGSFNSQSGEFIVTNIAGTVNSSLTAAGSCTAPTSITGLGTAQLTLSGGAPFANNTLNFAFLDLVFPDPTSNPPNQPTFLGALILETDSIGANQPILSGFGEPDFGFGQISSAYFAANGPFLWPFAGTTDGTVAKGTGIAGIARLVAVAGSGNSGSVSGVIDENAAGTITTQAVLPYSNYSVDQNGMGTISGTGQPTIHFLLGGSSDLFALDESKQVLTGTFRPQNSTTIESPGERYILINNSYTTLGGVAATGVVIPSGTTAGTLTGTVDLNGELGPTAAFSASGTYGAPSYLSLDSTTGRGTGVANLTNTSSENVVVYTWRHRKFLVLNVDPASLDPYLLEFDLE